MLKAVNDALMKAIKTMHKHLNGALVKVSASLRLSLAPKCASG